jgi:hypothetical protein
MNAEAYSELGRRNLTIGGGQRLDGRSATLVHQLAVTAGG